VHFRGTGPTTSEVDTVSLHRNSSLFIAALLLGAPLTACGTGGETDDGNSGQQTPTAVPTNDDGDSGVEGGGDDETSQDGGDGSGE
jgi:hypothetical protein